MFTSGRRNFAKTGFITSRPKETRIRPPGARNRMIPWEGIGGVGWREMMRIAKIFQKGPGGGRVTGAFCLLTADPEAED